MQTALSSKRSWIARIAVLAMVASLMAIAAPAGAAIDTSASCPASITDSGPFTDLAGVPDAAVDAINCIADYGISQGTSATTFDPFNDVPRWQMALFLTRQAEVHGLTLPDGSDQGFNDLAGVPAAAVTAINQTAQLNISEGTSATTFDPFSDVERWQMALFLTRLITEAGITLPSGADQGFTDLAGVPATAVTAINQLAQLDVADGTSATTYDPFGNVERWAMALFLTRVLAADGIVPTGAYFYVTAKDTSKNSITYSNGSAKVTLTYSDTDSFSRNGSSVNLALFESTLNTLVTAGTTGVTDGVVALQIDPATLDLKTNVDAKAGLVGTVATTEAWIVEPVTGIVIGEIWYGAGNDFNLFTVGGTSTTQTGFDADISVGDTIAATGGDATTNAKIRTLALTNGTASGKVTNDGATVFTIGVLVVPDPVDGDTKSVDGTSVATAAAFLAELTVGDTATYARAGGVQTYTLTNAAPTPVTGVAKASKVALVDTVAAADDTDETFVLISSGSASTVTLRDSGTETLVDATDSFADYKVNGTSVTAADFFAKLTAGDSVTYQMADTETSTTSSIALTDVNGIPTATEVTTITVGSDTLTIELGNGDDDSEAISYISSDLLGVKTGAGGVVKYMVNGVASANVGDWESDVAAFITAPSITPKVTLTTSGNDLVWNVTSS